MKTSVAGKAAALLIFISLCSACGELETMLPSTGSYQVRTLVNGSSLESCSIIRSDDKIRPYFTISVANDPDLIGLLVYFENSQGEVAGEKVRYILKTYAEEVKSAETEKKEEAKPNTTNDKTSEETNKTTEEQVTTTEKITQKTEETEKTEVKEQKTGELPEQETVQETVKEKKAVIDTKPVVKNTVVDITVKSLSEELPYLPLPKTLDIGPYTLVFEAIGLKETLSRTETSVFYLGNAEFYLKDISIYLSGQASSQLISPGTTVMLETRLDFDSRLDPYVIWYNGKNIISEGKISNGAGTILWKAPDQAGFYSLRLEIFPLQLKRNNYTGVSREITLPVSPKAVNLSYFFENNREHTARSSLATGTAYPQQVRLITAMIAAMKESDNSSENTKKTEKGKEKQSLPTEPPALPPTLPPPPELLQWYQFEGSLHNAMSPLADTQSLAPVSRKAPKWAAVGQSYGLSTGADDAYSLPPIKFFRKENDQGGGIFLLHIMPAAEGVIFSAFFPLQSSSTDGVWMNMVRKENTIILRLSSEGSIVEIPVYLTFFEPQSLIPIVVEFYIRPYRLEAKLSLNEESSPENKVGNIKLPGALSGECRIRLGGGTNTFTTDTSVTDKLTADNSTADKSTTNKSTTDNLTTDKAKAETSSRVLSSAQSTPNATESSLEETLAAITATTDSVEKDADITITTSETLSLPVNQNTIWNEFAVLFSTVPLLEEAPPAELTDEKQDATGTKTTGLKSESRVPAVQNKTAAAAADSKSDSKSDAKPDSNNKSVDNKPATTTETTITDSLKSSGSTPSSTSLKEQIPMPDTDKTEARVPEGDENLILPAADNSIPEIAPQKTGI